MKIPPYEKVRMSAHAMASVKSYIIRFPKILKTVVISKCMRVFHCNNDMLMINAVDKIR